MSNCNTNTSGRCKWRHCEMSLVHRIWVCLRLFFFTICDTGWGTRHTNDGETCLLCHMNILILICVAEGFYVLNAFLLNRRHVRSFFHPLTPLMGCMPWPLLSRISRVRIFLSVVLLIHLMTQWRQSISRWIINRDLVRVQILHTLIQNI